MSSFFLICQKEICCSGHFSLNCSAIRSQFITSEDGDLGYPSASFMVEEVLLWESGFYCTSWDVWL